MACRTRELVPIAIGEIYKRCDDGKLFRICYTGLEQNYTYLLPIEGSRLKFLRILTDEFRRLAGANETPQGYVLVKQAGFATPIPTPGDITKSAEMRKRIRALIDLKTPEGRKNRLRLMDPSGNQTRFLDECAEKMGTSRQTLQLALRRYFQRGMGSLAPLSNYWKSGHKVSSTGEPQRRVYTKVPGPRSSVADTATALPCLWLERLLRQATDIYATRKQCPFEFSLPDDEQSTTIRRDGRLKNSYRPKPAASGDGRTGGQTRRTRRGPKGRSIQRKLVDWMNWRARTERMVKDADGHVVELELAPGNRITIDQFRYAWSKVSPVVRLRAAARDHASMRRGKPKTGNAFQHCRGPGHVFFVDATVADIFLVSSQDRTIVVGRPTVYFIVDLDSRVIAGLHVSFNPPSFEGAALAIESMVTPKDEFCREYGFTIKKEDWPCEHVPVKFHVDFGCEYRRSVAWDTFLQMFDLGLDNSKPFEPFWRAVIERRFGIVPVMALRHGYAVVEKEVQSRPAPKYAWDACMTRVEFTRALLRAIHDYHRTPITGPVSDPKMVSTGRAPTPLELWRWGVQSSKAALAVCNDVDAIRRVTWETRTATITEQGIKSRNAYYAYDRFEETLAATVLSRGSAEIEVKVHPDRLTEIYVPSLGAAAVRATLCNSNRVNLDEAAPVEWDLVNKWNSRNSRNALHKEQPTRIMNALNSAMDAKRARQETNEALNAKGMLHPDDRTVQKAKRQEAELDNKVRAARHKQKDPAEEKPTSGETDGRPDFDRVHSRNIMRLLRG